jgi:hypothetical protein
MFVPPSSRGAQPAMHTTTAWRTEPDVVPVHVEVRRLGCSRRKPAPDDLRDRIHDLIATLPIIEDGLLDFSAHAVGSKFVATESSPTASITVQPFEFPFLTRLAPRTSTLDVARSTSTSENVKIIAPCRSCRMHSHLRISRSAKRRGRGSRSKW